MPFVSSMVCTVRSLRRVLRCRLTGVSGAHKRHRDEGESDAHRRLEKRVRAFLKGCTLPVISTLSVDIEVELVRWLQADPTFKSKSEQLLGHNTQ